MVRRVRERERGATKPKYGVLCRKCRCYTIFYVLSNFSYVSGLKVGMDRREEAGSRVREREECHASRCGRDFKLIVD